MSRGIGAASFGCGMLFATGLVLSGMTLPSKVIGFLDIAGDWDPSLALVMGGALAVLFAVRLVTPPRPLLAAVFPTFERERVDVSLALGAVLFGVGWGLSGFCPGPALVSASSGARAAWVFLPAMVAGMFVERLFRRRAPAAGPTPACG